MRFVATVVIALFLGMFSEPIQAQQVQYLDNTLRTVKSARLATYTRQLTPLGGEEFKAEIKTREGVVKVKGGYIKIKDELLEHGEFTFFYPNGAVESRGRYEKGVKVGVWERYAMDGQRKPDRYYNPESADVLRQVMNQ
ncbi:MAG: toxin-antitoxin system YwqK family antitoxin [Flavobacteriales bacterium]|jgi:hypothetical protein